MGRTKSNKEEKQIQTIAKKIRNKRPEKTKDFSEYLRIPTPSTTLNLACSGFPDFAFLTGSIVNLIGDSWAGKTMIALSIFAELNLIPEFDDFRFIYDDTEYANQFDVPYLFGEETASRIVAPEYEESEDEDGEEYPLFSSTIEDFHCNILDALEEDESFIYILDSFDALDETSDRKKIEEMREARRKRKKAKGTYAMGKPKKASQILRNIDDKLSESNSFLLVISQTRDNVDPLSFKKSTRAGGRALKFYSSHEIWLASAKRHKRSDLIIGGNTIAKVEKSKLTGKIREATFPIFNDIGVDDIRSCIEYLVKTGEWKKTKKTIHAEHFKVEGLISTIIDSIEERNLEPKLRKLVARTWNKIEEKVKLKRKMRYK